MKKTIFIIINFLTFLSIYSQTIVSVIPDHGNAGDTLNITVNCIKTHFKPTNIYHFIFYGKNLHYDNDNNVNIFLSKDPYIINDSTINLSIEIQENIPEGYYSLEILDLYNKINLFSGYAFYVNNPTDRNIKIVKLIPDSGKAGQRLDVTIISEYLPYMDSGTTGDYLYRFRNDNENETGIHMPMFGPALNDSMSLSINISQFATQGYNNFSIVSWDDQWIATKYKAFYIIAPDGPGIKSLTPNFSVNNQTLDITITGANTKFKESKFLLNSMHYLSLYNFDSETGQININSINPINDTTMLLNITIPPDVPNGYSNFIIYDSLTGYNDYGMINAFWVGPYLTGISPDVTQPGVTISIDLNTLNANFNNSGNIKVWLRNFDGYNPEIDATKVEVKGAQKLSAIFNIPTMIKQGLWDVYIADYSNGVFYRNKILQIGTITKVNETGALKTEELKVFPNPASSTIVVSCPLIGKGDVQIGIYDLLGREVDELGIRNYKLGIKGENRISVEVGDLRNGVYFVRVETGKGVMVGKFVKE